ncbi:MAG: peroxidase [Acidobacteria bacterium]|nr:MAG: peroxidase [Acidobacteriota bacterium]
MAGWFKPWHERGIVGGLLALLGIRNQLRRENLYDTEPELEKKAPPGPEDRRRRARMADGTYNDLETPGMGRVGARFGRNVPLNRGFPDTERLLEPSPREVSRKLMKRDAFVPAEHINLLVAAWIQFQVHGWFSHGPNQKDNQFNIPLEADDPWPDSERPMLIRRTQPDTTRTEESKHLPPTFTNTESFWWDSSQLYGSSEEQQAIVRGEGGKLHIGDDGLLPLDESGIDITGFNKNWWVGLSLMHTLFTLEHNAICDRLAADNPKWSDDDLFDHARLVNAALIAKIHTVEWTPAILDHPGAIAGLEGNWWGLFGKGKERTFGRRFDTFRGIPGSRTDHHGTPYSLTEEFVSVYRFHPLMPDAYDFRSLTDDTVLNDATLALEDVTGAEARGVVNAFGMANLFYTFGTALSGAPVLHNFPDGLRELRRRDGALVDLAAIDILRDRERGVPRYNDFRELLHLERVTSFEELTANATWQREIRELYKDDVDAVDLQVGLFAETFPKGFGFGDTVFRVFILMASRRLKSDRFLSRDFTPEIYTQAGIDWVDNTTMVDVLKRHYPELEARLRGVDNAFTPWQKQGT